MRPIAPTARHLDVLRALAAGTASGLPPSEIEIGRWVGLGRSRVHVLLVALEDRGLICHRPGEHRTAVLTAAGREALLAAA